MRDLPRQEASCILRITLGASTGYSMRSMPPSTTAKGLQWFDSECEAAVEWLCGQGDLQQKTRARMNLPLRLGGLGIPKATGYGGIAKSVYIAGLIGCFQSVLESIHPTIKQFSYDLDHVLINEVQPHSPHMRECKELLQSTKGLGDEDIGTSFHTMLKILPQKHLQRTITHLLYQGRFDELFNQQYPVTFMTNAQIAKLNSCAQNGARMWLHSIPTSDHRNIYINLPLFHKRTYNLHLRLAFQTSNIMSATSK